MVYIQIANYLYHSFHEFHELVCYQSLIVLISYETLQKKISKVKELKCDYFIDDLEEILKKLPKKIKKIHFDPYKKSKKPSLKSWGSLIEVMKNNDK